MLLFSHSPVQLDGAEPHELRRLTTGAALELDFYQIGEGQGTERVKAIVHWIRQRITWYDEQGGFFPNEMRLLQGLMIKTGLLTSSVINVAQLLKEVEKVRIRLEAVAEQPQWFMEHNHVEFNCMSNFCDNSPKPLTQTCKVQMREISWHLLPKLNSEGRPYQVRTAFIHEIYPSSLQRLNPVKEKRGSG